MKKFITTLCIALLMNLSMIGQQRVVDISQLNIPGSVLVEPDVNGKVLITDEFYNKLSASILPDPIELYPNWPLSYTGSSQRGGIYCNLDEDDDLEIVYSISLQTYAWNPDGSVVDGWPVNLSYYPDGAPAFGDIDGDGEGEIVISGRSAGTGNNGQLYAFEKDGSPVAGFPVSLSGGATKTPALGDLNGDGAYEIIVEERDYPNGFVGVYSGDGSAFPGFPVEMGEIPGSAAAVGDITGDNVPEIVAESYYNVFVYDASGNLLDGFPYSPGSDRVFSYSSPVLADLDGDGLKDILVGDHSTTSGNGAVSAIRFDATPLDGWPKTVGYWIYGPPAVGDIDGDGSPDVAIGDQVLSTSPADKVYVWDKNGNLLPGWPTPSINAINNQIILADLDGDDQVELMWDDNTNEGTYIGYNHDGTVMDGWPLTVTGSSFFMNPFVTDINNDGILDLSGASTNIGTSDLYFYLWNVNENVNPEKSPLTILQYNVRHDGVFTGASVLNANFIASPVELCEGGDVQFTDQSAGDVVSWEWAFEGGDPATSTQQNPLINYASSGVYDVSLIISDGTTTDTVTKTDFIHTGYDPVIPDQPVGPDNFKTDTANFTIYETWAPNADDYTWELIPDDVGVLTAGDTITKVKIYWSTDDNYMAELHVKSENICGESDFSESLIIHVNWTIGTNEQDESKPYTCFPNPNDGQFTISFEPGPMPATVTLLDDRGTEIEVFETNRPTLTIDGLESGLYFLKIQRNDQEYFEKIVVE